MMCGIINCPGQADTGSATMVMPDGRAVPICQHCAEERVIWPRGVPYRNHTGVIRACPHCQSMIACGATCTCIPQPFASEREPITRLDNYIVRRFPNQIRGGEHACDAAIRILDDLAKRM
jgi:hypothetical protein